MVKELVLAVKELPKLEIDIKYRVTSGRKGYYIHIPFDQLVGPRYHYNHGKLEKVEYVVAQGKQKIVVEYLVAESKVSIAHLTGV